MLKRALQFLSPGGTLIYCVCSPLFEEGEAIINTITESGLAKRNPIDADALGPFSGCLTKNGDVHILGLDAIPDADPFFIARLSSVS